MGCTSCGDKPTNTAKDFTKAVIEINNPETLVLLRKVVIPASISEADNPPAVGKYRNVILKYEDTGNVYLYSSDGIPTVIEANVPQEILDKITNLEDGIADEISARQAADTDLGTRIDGVSTALSNEATARESADSAIQGDIDSIEEKIPNQASSQNQLADKDFVNSSIATNTANYISDNGQPFQSLASLEAYSGTLTNNDYAFVVGTDQVGNTTYTRYKYVASAGEWAEEYVLNNSSFTAAQWAAINSNITSNDVNKLAGIAAGAEPNTIDSISVNGSPVTPDSNKNVDLIIEYPEVVVLHSSNNVVDLDELESFITGLQNNKVGFLYVEGSWHKVDSYTIDNANLSGNFVEPIHPNSFYIRDFSFTINRQTGAIAGNVDSVTVKTPPTVVQTTGSSTAYVMSQDAVTDMVYARNNPASGILSDVRIGKSASVTLHISSGSTAIGDFARASGIQSVALGGSNGSSTSADARGDYSVAIGRGSSSAGESAVALGAGAWTGDKSSISPAYSVALGANSTTSVQGEVSFGGTKLGTNGYNNSQYRLLTNVYEPQSVHDAATKGYVDPSTDATAPTSSTAGRLGEIRIDTSTNTAYMCVSADSATSTYVWKQITA